MNKSIHKFKNREAYNSPLENIPAPVKWFFNKNILGYALLSFAERS
jgi:hypothetical protein